MTNYKVAAYLAACRLAKMFYEGQRNSVMVMLDGVPNKVLVDSENKLSHILPHLGLDVGTECIRNTLLWDIPDEDLIVDNFIHSSF